MQDGKALIVSNHSVVVVAAALLAVLSAAVAGREGKTS